VESIGHFIYQGILLLKNTKVSSVSYIYNYPKPSPSCQKQDKLPRLTLNSSNQKVLIYMLTGLQKFTFMFL